MTATDPLADARRVERVMDDIVQEADRTAEVDIAPDRSRLFSSMSFARMRTNWTTEDRDVIDAARTQAEREVMIHFGDIYRILNNLYQIVREPEMTPKGEVAKDDYGFSKWRKDATGMYVEDWSKLTERDKEAMLFSITSRMVFWEQVAAEWWGEAMFAKGIWEDRFATSFQDTASMQNKRPTVDDRTQHAQANARDQRYFAIFLSMRSKKSDALVRSMERLAQRIKDTIR
jgi:hypothetical protein